MPEVIEVTGKILFEIRDEIRQTRENLSNQMMGLAERVGRVEENVAEIKQDLKAVHGFLQRDLIALADRVGRIERYLHLDAAN